MLVAQGGVSRSLVYRVPAQWILEISSEHRTVTVDLDVADFVPCLGNDGTVVLELTR
jgi:hypothetical protein